jgi:cell wall-associated NlpC family hydrolase
LALATDSLRARALSVALALSAIACSPEARAQARPRAAHTRRPTLAYAHPAPTVAPAPVAVATPAPSAAAARVTAQLDAIEQNLRVASYRHDTRVNERQGRYEFDCSGLIAWVLARAAPEAHRVTVQRASGPRPLAAEYARTFLSVAPTQRRGPWTRVQRVEDARPGDVIAWIKPRIVRSNNTGHVLFVVGAPRRSERYTDAWLVPVADSSRYRHQDDSREGTTRTGFGRGTILLATDPTTGAPRAFGDHTPYVLETQIAIGRPER